MSFISKVRKIGSKIGGVVKKAAPLAGLIPGVGPLAGFGIGALGSIMEGHNGVGGTLKAGAGGAAGGLANKVLLNGQGYKGLGALVKGGAGGAAGKVGNAVKTAAGGAGSALAGVLGKSGGGFGLKDLLALGIGGAGAVSGIKDSRAARAREAELTGKQLGLADETAGYGRDMIARSKPLLDAGSTGLLDRLKQGPRKTQSFSRFRDLTNPMSGQFS
jgi:hypothetical protein